MDNEDREAYGHDAIHAGCDIDEADEQANLVDALTNIMHYAAAEKLDFYAALQTAQMHFNAER